MSAERKTCTKESPMPQFADGYWFHPDAVSGDDENYGLSGGGDYATYTCPHCGKFFREQLPD